MLLIISKETTFPREQIRQIIMTSVISVVGGDDGVGKVNVAPIFRRMRSTGGGDTVLDVKAGGIVNRIVDWNSEAFWVLED